MLHMIGMSFPGC